MSGKILVASNKPLFPEDETTFFLVEEGQVELFLVSGDKTNPTGTRTHLATLPKNRLLFCFSPPPYYHIVATGLPHTRVRTYSLQDLPALLERGALSYGQLEQWIEQLSMIAPPPPKKFVELRHHSSRTLTEGACLRSTQGVLWVEGEALSFLGEYPLSSALIPVTNPAWLLVLQSQKVVSYSTKEVLMRPFLPSLKSFHGLVLKVAIKKKEQEKEQERLRLLERETYDRQSFNDSLTTLSAVFGQETKSPRIAPKDQLLACFLELAKALDVPIGVSNLEENLTPREVSEQLGLRTREVRLSGTWWKEDGGPLLGFTEEGEPVALLPRNSSSYLLYSPKTGEKRRIQGPIPRLTSQAYAFYRPLPQKKIHLLDLLLFVKGSLRKEDLLRILLCGVLGSALGLLLPMATALIFDRVIPEADQGSVLQIAILLFSSVFAITLFEITRSFATVRIKTRIDYELQSALWDRMLSLPVPFFRNYTSGELAQRAMSVTYMRDILSDTVLTGALGGVFSLLYFIQMYSYSPTLTLGVTVLVVGLLGITISLSLFQLKYDRQWMGAYNRLSGLVLQLIGGLPKIKVQGAEHRVFLLWSKGFSALRKTTYKMESLSHIVSTIQSIFPIVATMLTFYLIARNSSVISNTGSFVGFHVALGSYLALLLSFSQSVVRFLSIFPLLENTRPILGSLPEIEHAKKSPGRLEGALEVSNLSFRYQKEGALILKNISLQVAPGDYVAIVGPSGCGKSTLLRLLLGFETPEQGQILYDDHDLSRVNVRSIRRQLGVVLQNSSLITGAILNNILGSNASLTIEDAWEAARMAGVDTDIAAMPMRMHTVVSEGGSTLSGGQRQRILIARALAQKPALLIFDEATSALDNQTQKIVGLSLKKLGVTRLVIAHRLSTVMDCHRIYVMDQGEIVESGTFTDLLKKKGLFSELAARQQAKD